MTLGALLGVAVLAAQAARATPKVSNAANKQSATAPVSQSNKRTTTSPAGTALPANSGSGTRIVYSVGGQRVWLVGTDGGTVERTFQVVPGTIAVPPGSYTVTEKQSGLTGSDGTPVVYVVLFGQRTVSGVPTAFGFDAVANVTGLPPKPSSRTGGIRMAQLDAQALFEFASVDMKVAVVN
jgi:lipoprotein-anchoring transpeptidase ErfK/SrfK